MKRTRPFALKRKTWNLLYKCSPLSGNTFVCCHPLQYTGYILKTVILENWNISVNFNLITKSNILLEIKYLEDCNTFINVYNWHALEDLHSAQNIYHISPYNVALLILPTFLRMIFNTGKYILYTLPFR